MTDGRVMNFNIYALNEGLALKGITAKFVSAEDKTVDDEIALYVAGRVEPVAGIQLHHGWFIPNCRTAAYEMHVAPKERSLNAAVGHAVYLLRKYGWIAR